nr:dihydrolipoyl dehydrogenase [uncultured Shinella sp.]
MMEEFDFDVLVIGGGPGGYACAIRAAQLGLATACVEGRDTLGGTCLNVGCIPSKALLTASHHFHTAAHGALSDYGIKVENVSLDLSKMMARKDATVHSLTKGIDFLFRKHKIVRIEGWAAFSGHNRVSISGRDYTAKSIVIATGSDPSPFRSVDVNNQEGIIIDSTGALALKAVPETMVVVGGGVIGLELGSVWSRLGSKVIVLEYLDDILPGMDRDIRVRVRQLVEKQGLDIRTSVQVQSIERAGDSAAITVEAEGAPETIMADTVLIATGRRPNTSKLHLDIIGIDTDDRGFIPVDGAARTAVNGIYAIGDVTNGPMLAHRAGDEGIALAERLAGIPRDVNHAIVPAVVYTDPEVASVGLTEEAAKATGRPFRVSTFPMAANGRAKVNGETDGFVKIISDEQTDVILGAHIVASLAGTMIAQIAQAMEFGATAEDVAYTCHAHPTHSEAVKEAALGIGGGAIHA